MLIFLLVDFTVLKVRQAWYGVTMLMRVLDSDQALCGRFAGWEWKRSIFAAVMELSHGSCSPLVRVRRLETLSMMHFQEPSV